MKLWDSSTVNTFISSMYVWGTYSGIITYFPKSCYCALVLSITLHQCWLHAHMVGIRYIFIWTSLCTCTHTIMSSIDTHTHTHTRCTHKRDRHKHREKVGDRDNHYTYQKMLHTCKHTQTETIQKITDENRLTKGRAHTVNSNTGGNTWEIPQEFVEIHSPESCWLHSTLAWIGSCSLYRGLISLQFTT